MKSLAVFVLLAFPFISFGQNINFPDPDFKSRLLELGIDKNGDSEITIQEAELVDSLNINSGPSTIYFYSQISSLEGIQHFKNLKFLNCRYNKLNSLGVTGLTNLETLYCSSNPLVELDVSELFNLVRLECIFNNLVSLNISGLSNLIDIRCSSNQLTELDVSSFANLEAIGCSQNLLSNLDVSNLSNLEHLYCTNNQLITLNLKSGKKLSTLSFDANNDLSYLCVNDFELIKYTNKVIECGYNCVVNSYCSFDPGGDFYTIMGSFVLSLLSFQAIRK